MNENTVKWLQILSYVALVSLLNPVLAMIPALPSGLPLWLSRGIMLAMVLCTYQLRKENGCYQKAALYQAIVLGCNLAVAYLFQSSILTFAASILSIMAVYQEYKGHSELVAALNAKLSAKWHSLFYWGLVVGILLSFGTIIASVLVAVAGMDVDRAVAVIVVVLSIPQVIIDTLYFLYLKKTTQTVANAKTSLM